MIGDKVTINRGRTELLEWKVIKELSRDTLEFEKESIGLSDYQQMMHNVQLVTF
jgi:hypothetical protein